MATTLLTIPPELRLQIYDLAFAEYAKTPHENLLFTHTKCDVARLASEARREHRTFEAQFLAGQRHDWCCGPEQIPGASSGPSNSSPEASNGDEYVYTPQYSQPTCGSKPLDLLLVHSKIYHEASPIFLRLTTPYITFLQGDVTSFTQRWQHASPAQNVRSVLVGWDDDNWRSDTDAEASMALLASQFPALTSLEVWFDRSTPETAYDVLRECIPAFANLEELVIEDQDLQRVDYERQVMEEEENSGFFVRTYVNAERFSWEPDGRTPSIGRERRWLKMLGLTLIIDEQGFELVLPPLPHSDDEIMDDEAGEIGTRVSEVEEKDEAEETDEAGSEVGTSTEEDDLSDGEPEWVCTPSFFDLLSQELRSSLPSG